MKKTGFLLSLLLLATFLQAQRTPELSENARVSLMTVAPGEFLYSTFGHSAIRVYDPVLGIDRCFNYGTFDFRQPNFYLKFCQGRLLYFLDIEPYRNFEYGNLYDRRSMQEQILNLQQDEKQRLFGLLVENAREENRYYQYDFFYDNCATRIRDIVQETFYHQIVFDSSRIAPERTMRQLLHPYLEKMPWTRFGIDIVLGLPADRQAYAENYMFLPDYVHHLFADSRLPDGRAMVAREILNPDPPFPPVPFDPGLFGRPIWVIVLIVLLGLLSMATPRSARIFDTVFWLSLGVAGLIVFLLWFATEHSATKMNWNLFWALPTHLLFFWRSRRSEWVDNYFMGVAMLAGLGLLLWKFIPQQLPPEAIPIALLVVVKGLWGKKSLAERISGSETGKEEP